MLEDIIKERHRKLKNFIDAGINPYPSKVRRTNYISDILKNFKKLTIVKKQFFVAARIMSLRDQGNLIFIDLKDETGIIQGVLKKDNINNFKIWKQNLDIGDYLAIGGNLFKTKKGEKSVEIKKIEIAAKNLRPLPDQWCGLENIEIRLRKRYLDILLNPEIKKIFIKKNIFWQTFREILQKNGFFEVETPILEATPGGADAEPFITRHNALNTDFYLRISLEIALKKLLVAGYEKIFEIGRIFRNEGISNEHLQDYTQLEFYWAYADYNDLMKFVEKMYKAVIKKINGKLIVEWQNKKINWGKKWQRIEYYEIFKRKTGIDLEKAAIQELFEKAQKENLKPEKSLGKGRLIDLIFKKIIRPGLIQPCFLINAPEDIEPLAKRLKDNPHKVARFQIIACGTELGKGFSEANDPIDERKRFEEQIKLREKGDKEAQRMDEDFLEALEYGMPPSAGFGVSERLFSVLMNKPIRETIFFPLMKKAKNRI